MKRAYVFPGQGAQFPGMGKDLYDSNPEAKEVFKTANEILGFDISNVMFYGTGDELKQTNITQPAIFIHSIAIKTSLGDDFKPDMVAGHSLGEFSALVANKALTFENGLNLVKERAEAMQVACKKEPSTMAAILGLEDSVIEEVCDSLTGVVVPANYNSPGQIVISGTIEGVEEACKILSERGARRALILNVGGAFHSPLMEPAKSRLAEAIKDTKISDPVCPIYQNATATPNTDPTEIKKNLIAQLTAPVKWTQSVKNMISDGGSCFTELGPGKVLQSLIRKIDRSIEIINI